MLSTGVVIALLLIFIFIGLIVILDRLDLLEPVGFELSGPFLMWKTKKGRSLIDRIAQKKRFWKIFGTMGIVITAIAMVIILFMVAFSAYVATDVPAEQAPEAKEVLVLPGINPFIPIGYGIFSVAVAMIVHEFTHGILTRVADVKINALGIILLVVPLGAFCEPDEEEIEETERIKRDRMFAAGPTSNIVLGIVLFLIFSTLFMGFVSPEEDALLVMDMYEDTPADQAGIQPNDHLLEIDNESIRTLNDLEDVDVNLTKDDDQELRKVSVRGRRGEDEVIFENVTPGLVILSIRKDSPAYNSELEIKDIISHVEGKEIRNRSALHEALDDKDDQEEFNLTYWRRINREYQKNTTTVMLEDGKLGIGVNYLGFGFQEGDWYPKFLARPISSAETNTERIQNVAMYISLPLFGLSPVPDEMTGFYEISGPLSSLPSGAFWILANSIYWVLWLNILLGLFNALPALPLDGGRLFKDWIGSITERVGASEELGEKVSTGLTYAMSFSILFLLMWQLIGPRI
ncbi:MAG: site-2 protease family protein [Candidatus Thermoplasmatota archaeon]